MHKQTLGGSIYSGLQKGLHVGQKAVEYSALAKGIYETGQMLFSVETPHKFRDKNGKPQHCYNFIDLPVHGDLLEKIEDDIVSGAYFKNRTKRGFVLNKSEL